MDALSGQDGYGSNVDKLTEILDKFFSGAFQDHHKNKFFDLRDVKTVVDWYQQAENFKGKVDNAVNNLSLSDPMSMVANKTIEMMLEKVRPYYEQCLIEKIGFKTQFKNGSVENNFRVEFKPILFHVDFTKEVNEKDICTIRFRFKLSAKNYISSLNIQYNEGEMLCHIEKAGIELELYLTEIIVTYIGADQISVPYKKTTRLANKKLEVQNLVLKK